MTSTSDRDSGAASNLDIQDAGYSSTCSDSATVTAYSSAFGYSGYWISNACSDYAITCAESLEGHAQRMRKRDLGYLSPRLPDFKRLRFQVTAPFARFRPVTRQIRSVHCCRRRALRGGGGLRRLFVCRNARLVALRIKCA